MRNGNHCFPHHERVQLFLDRVLRFGVECGSCFVETMLSVIETCRQQQRPVFAYLANTLAAHFANRPAPSLLARA